MKRPKVKDGQEILGKTAFLITDVARRYRTTFDERVRHLELTRSEWWLIRFLHFFEGNTQAELTEVMDITKGGMGKLIDRLESVGLVKRGVDGADRRTNRIYLTAKAKPLAAQLHRYSEEIEAKALATLNKEEVAILDALLTRVRQGFEDAKESADLVVAKKPHRRTR